MVWWALARNENRFPISTVYSSITVSSAWKTLFQSGNLYYRQSAHVPSGLTPDCHPSGGAKAAICASVGDVVLLDDVVDVVFTADEGEGDAGEDVWGDVVGHEPMLVA